MRQDEKDWYNEVGGDGSPKAQQKKGAKHMKEAAFSLVIVVLLGLSSCWCGKEVNHADCGDFDSFETGTSRVDIEEMSGTITPTQYIETIPYTEFIAEEKKNRGIDSEDMIGDKKEFSATTRFSPLCFN